MYGLLYGVSITVWILEYHPPSFVGHVGRTAEVSANLSQSSWGQVGHSEHELPALRVLLPRRAGHDPIIARLDTTFANEHHSPETSRPSSVLRERFPWLIETAHV